MAITTTQAQGLVLALFGASAGGHLTGLAAASNLNTLAGDLTMSAGLILGKDLSSNTAFRDHITSNLKLTGDALTAANAWLDGQLNAGAARGDMVATAVTFLATLTDTTSPFYAAAQTFNTTVADAVTWSTGAGATTFGVSALRANQGNVDVVPGASFTLTTGTDTLIGTAGNDTFSGALTTVDSTLTAGDQAIDQSTTDSDVLNLTLNDNLADNTITVANVESVNLTVASTATEDNNVSDFSGVKNLTVTRTNLTVGGSSIAGDKSVTVSAVDASKIAAVTAGASTTNVTVTQATKAGVVVNADAATGNTTVVGAATVNAAGAGAGDTITVTAFNDAQAGTAAKAAVENAKAVSVTTGAATVTVEGNDADGAGAGTDLNQFTGTVTVSAAAASAVTIANAAGGATVTATRNSNATANTTITVNNIDDSGATITAGTGTTTTAVVIDIDGTSGTTDAATIKAAGSVTLNASVGTTDIVDNLNLSGNGAAVTYTLASPDNGAATTKFTLSGDQSVTLVSTAAALTLTTVTDTTTAGSTKVKLSTVATSDLSKVAADAIEFAGTANASQTVTLATGANVVLAKDQTNGIAIAGKAADATISLSTADDTAADGSTIEIEVGALTASTNVKTLNIDATVGKFTATSLTVGTAGTVNVTGTKDVALGNITAKVVAAGTLTGALSLNTANAELTTITAGTGADTLVLDEAATYTLDAGAGNDTVTLGANVAVASVAVGGEGNDTVNVDTAAAIVVSAGAGTDTVTIGAALDADGIYAGGEGTDTLTFADTDGEDLSNNTNFAFAGFETLNIAALTSGAIKISNAQFAAQTFALTGSVAADTLTIAGTASADTIDASTITVTTATVQIDGAAGDDVMTGTASADTFLAGVGSDVISGGSGNDTVTYGTVDNADTGTQTGVVVNLSTSAITNTTILGQLGTSAGYTAGSVTSVAANTAAYLYGDTTATNSAAVDTFNSVENVTGSDGIDYIIGSAGANVILGDAGADYINPGLGADTVTGGAGNDTIVLTESTGSVDKLIFSASNGADTISGFAVGASGDKLNFAAYFGTGVTLATTDIGGVGTGSADVYAMGSTNTALAKKISVVFETSDGLASGDFGTATGKINMTKGVVIYAVGSDAAAAAAATTFKVYYVDAAGDTAGLATTAVDTANEIVLVGTITATAGVESLLLANFDI
jgi:Ca2+-binding RTX toxin-like protein